VRQHTARGDNPLSSLSWAAAELVGAPVTEREPGGHSPVAELLRTAQSFAVDELLPGARPGPGSR
jgi:hypothetical protein